MQAGFEALYFDTIVFDRDAFEFLARKAGTQRILLGSDMPFPIGDLAPRKLVESMGWSKAEEAAVLGDTAQKVFRLRADCLC
jgi:aminocarboxymuconate-semialdehyde decarboxylase